MLTTTPTMARICCMCGREMGTVHCAPQCAGLVTHGYCKRCLLVVLLADGAVPVNLAKLESRRITDAHI